MPGNRPLSTFCDSPFEAEPRTDDDNYGVFANRVMAFLQSVGEILVVVVGTDGQNYVITRSGGYDKAQQASNHNLYRLSPSLSGC